MICAIGLMSLPVCAQLDSVDSRTLLRQAHKYKYGINTDVSLRKAAAIYMHLARKGHIDGMRELGRMYLKGQGVPRNSRYAARLLKRAAQCGDTKAMCLLAEMYQHAMGVKQNYGEAFRLYSYAASKGSGRGCYGAGYMKYKGLGVKQDYAAAENLLKKGSERGDASCDFLLGSYYMNGYGGVPDYIKAEAYFSRAAKGGHGWTVDITKHGVLDSLKKARSLRVRALSAAARRMTCAEADSMLRFVQADSLEGSWSGTLYTCDWSGRKILEEQDFRLEIERLDTLISAEWTLGNSVKSGIFMPDERRGAWWCKGVFTDEDKEHGSALTSMAFGMGDINTLTVRPWTINTKTKERRKPMFAVLRRDNPVVDKSVSPFRIESVSPVPVTDGSFTVNLSSDIEGLVSISLYSVTGVKVADCGTVSVTEGKNPIPVRAALAKGQYVLRITGMDGNSAVSVVYL